MPLNKKGKKIKKSMEKNTARKKVSLYFMLWKILES